DGVTATTLLYSYFSERGLPVTFYIPNRLDEGYGLNEPAIRKLAEQGVTLIVTVDCGVACRDEVALAKSLGVDVIITDHHECPPSLPDAVAVIDPKRPDSSYPFSELAGVGVAFKLASALDGEGGIPSLLSRFSDLVAIGSLADVVPLVSENRALVRMGMEAIRHNPRIGLKALLEKSRSTDKSPTATDLTFTVVPRINAAGRMGSAEIGVDLLLSQDSETALSLAETLCATNDLRRTTEQDILKEAEAMLKEQPPKAGEVCILAHEGWHHGVLGIVAARLCDRYQTPFLLLSIEGDEAKGSGRSVEGISLFDTLSAVRAHIKQFGGHAQAVGLTVETHQLELLRQAVNENVAIHSEPTSEYLIDYVADIHELTVEVARELLLLEPFGAGNPAPQIGIFGGKITEIRPVGADGKHLKFRVSDGSGSIDGIGFSMGELYEQIFVGDYVDVVGELEENEYRGRSSAQLNLKAIRRCNHGEGI
ncbi:MAG: single-stranded-DNA-specific exonuclease RecJ, partial [Clostridia bacterium]|nr:single-stranded-DNA-specific exonuclease RecJ [Clostridia bacterium]